MRRLLGILLWLFTLPAFAAAPTSVQWGADRTTSTWPVGIFDSLQNFRPLFTQPQNGLPLLLNAAVPKPTSSALGGVESATAPTNQVMIGIDTNGVPTFAQVAFSNLAGTAQVSQGGTGQTSFTAGLPLLGSGTGGLAQGTLSGSGSKFGTVAGTPTDGNCAGWNAGNLVDEGSPCGSGGGGSGTVSAGTAGQLGYYASSGTVIAGNGNATISAGALTLGLAGTAQGSVKLSGSTSGTTTIAAPVSGGGTATLQAGSDTIVGRATTDTLTNKSISGSTNTLSNIPNAALVNPSVTFNTIACSLGVSCVIPMTDLAYTAIGTGAVPGNADQQVRQGSLSEWQFASASQIADARSYTDSLDQAGALQAWLTACITQKVSCYLPQGIYLATTQQLVFDLKNALTAGIYIWSDGYAEIDMRGNAANPPFIFEATGGTVGSPAGEVYSGIRGIHFDCSVAGSCGYIGQGDFSDAINEGEFNFSVQNFSSSASASCFNLNFMLSSYGKMNCSTGAGPTGGNVGFIGNQLNFDHFSFGGSNVGVLVLLTNGINTANHFDTGDCEVDGVCVESNSTGNISNTWTAGTWSYTSAGVLASAGANNLVQNPGINATAANFFTSGSSAFFKLEIPMTGVPTCGAGCSAVTGTNPSNEAFTLSTSLGVTSVAANFVPAWPIGTPTCNVSGSNGANIPFISSISASTVTVGFTGAATTSVYVQCH